MAFIKNMQFNFTKYSKFYYIISGILVVATIVCLFTFGLKFGIEFIGGSTMEVQFQTGQRPGNEAIQNALDGFDLGQITIQSIGADSAILQFKAQPVLITFLTASSLITGKVPG